MFYLMFVQAGSLLDIKLKTEFEDDVLEEYEEIREDHYDNIKV